MVTVLRTKTKHLLQKAKDMDETTKDILSAEKERMDNAINFRLAYAFFLSVVVHGTWFSRKRVNTYALFLKIMVQSYALFSQVKYPKKGILLGEI